MDPSPYYSGFPMSSPSTTTGSSGGGKDDDWHWWKNNAARAQKDMLQADLKRLQENPSSLGLTEPQKKQMIADATQAANAQQQAQVTQLGQQALAGTDVQAGALRTAATDVATHAADAAVGASANVEDLNARLIQQEADRIRGELDAQRQKARENAQFWSTLGINSFTSILGTLVGKNGVGSMSAGGAAPAE